MAYLSQNKMDSTLSNQEYCPSPSSTPVPPGRDISAYEPQLMKIPPTTQPQYSSKQQNRRRDHDHNRKRKHATHWRALFSHACHVMPFTVVKNPSRRLPSPGTTMRTPCCFSCGRCCWSTCISPSLLSYFCQTKDTMCGQALHRLSSSDDLQNFQPGGWRHKKTILATLER